MRTLTLGIAVATLMVGGCRKVGVGGIDRAEEATVSLLGCPPGTDEEGNVPPLGQDMWCSLRTESGTQRHGAARSWWRDGTTRSAGAYANNLKVGHWWFWDADGNLEREGPFREDKESGYWIYYRPDGSIADEGPMVDGEREGRWVTYDDATGVPSQGMWQDGQKEGVWVEYDPSGEPVTEREYRRGRLISQREL